MRPFIFVNLAMSADGKLSTRKRRQVKISGSGDFSRVDEIKAASDAIIVGIGTVLADDPSLTVKSTILKEKRVSDGKDENPVRIVVDSNARTPVDADILHKGPGQRIIAVSAHASPTQIERLRAHADIIVAGEYRVDLPLLFERLYERGIRRCMVEGGGTLIAALFEKDLVDELYTFVGNMVIGGANSPTPADGHGFINENEFTRLTLISVEPLDEGVLIKWIIQRSD